MKVIAYYCLHYAGDYFSESIKSIHNSVDKIVVLYSPKPSFGFSTDLIHPENMEDVKQRALNTSHKLEWIECSPSNEGEHTSLINNYAGGYDLILRADSDEIYDAEDLQDALKEAYSSNQRYYGIKGYINFFRSFDIVCYDGFTPIRIIKPFGIGNTTKDLKLKIYHFSCAQNEKLTQYKLSIHGHKSEERVNWYNEKFLGFKKGETKDLHLTSIGLWNPEIFDKTTLPEILKEHPYYNLDIIK